MYNYSHVSQEASELKAITCILILWANLSSSKAELKKQGPGPSIANKLIN